MPEVTGATRVLGVIGWPVSHSFSPPMHNAALSALGLDYIYVPFPVAPQDLSAALAGLRAAGVVGFNATIPHKEALCALVDHRTPEAELTGTVNTVHFTANGVVGDSTDGPGFLAALTAAGGGVEGLEVVVLGAGGSARAISVSLARAGAALLTLGNRTAARAELLADLLETRVRRGVTAVVEWEGDALARALSRADLIVQTTSVGMYPHSDEQPLRLPELKAGSRLVDIIYRPSRTRLMDEAAARGAQVANGVDMLVAQGALAFERWTGARAPLARMREALLAELEKRAAAAPNGVAEKR
jgi:shikimate dehydrogenase